MGVRVGHWLSAERAKVFLQAPNVGKMRGKRDRAIKSILVGCGVRRSEVAELKLEDIQERDERWTIPDLFGKGGQVIWCVINEFASKAKLGALAPHDLRRTCARLCHRVGGELKQIQFLLGHVTFKQATELGCKQKLRVSVHDHIGIEPED